MYMLPSEYIKLSYFCWVPCHPPPKQSRVNSSFLIHPSSFFTSFILPFATFKLFSSFVMINQYRLLTLKAMLLRVKGFDTDTSNYLWHEDIIIDCSGDIMTMSGQIGGEIFIEIPTTTDLRSTVILGARANSGQGRWGNTRDISILHLCLHCHCLPSQ